MVPTAFPVYLYRGIATMCNRHLLIIRIIEEDSIIFYDANKIIKTIRSDPEVSSEDRWAVDLVMVHKKL